MTAILAPPLRFKGWDANGLPLAFGTLGSYIAGTSTPQATYVDSTQTTPNLNPIPLDNRGECALWLDPTKIYKFVLFDQFGNQVNVTDQVQGSLTAAALSTVLTQAYLGAILYPQTAAEIAAGVSPTNFAYPCGDLRRYGGDPTGVADSSTAWQQLINVLAQTSGQGFGYIAAGCQFKILTGATYAGTNPIIIRGDGQTSQLLCDSTVLTCSGGASNSIMDNFAMLNITAPWIITRNPGNWAANMAPTLQQSNTVLGYQPTVNDADIWGSLTGAQQSQNIGPVLFFSGIASGITVSRIYGRFVRVEIRDAADSTIRDCDIRGGKGIWGSLAFDNFQNSLQLGSGNRAINNRVRYGSFSGIYFASNYDFTCSGNHSYRNGESGTKTTQAQGLVFSASVGGATTGAISAPTGAFLPNGTYNCVFSSGEARTITVTTGPVATWSGALAAGTVTTAYSWVSTSPFNPVCFRGLIVDNHVYQNFYDGLDCASTFATTCDAPRTYHQINSNHSYNNGGTGINADGQYNSYVGNTFYDNNTYGFWGTCSFSLIQGNHCIGNNVANAAGTSDFLGGIQGNSILGNRVIQIAPAQTYALNAAVASTGAPHVASDNYVIGGNAFWGNAEAIYVIQSRNIDTTTGTRTRQSGLMTLQNSAGTLQHIFYNDISTSAPAFATKIIGNGSGGFTNTPTGTDASTAFAGGAKISTTITNGIVLNTAAQWIGDVDFEARIVGNSVGSALMVAVSFDNININGVTIRRPTFRIFNATTGAAITLTGLIAGNVISIAFSGYLS